uniref:MFS domain-containing protein n=1 Tax=Syphacia muris TaxID=451379 RepID=A0A0N5AH40_9BILA
MITRFNVLKLFGICSLLTLTTNFPSGFTNSSVNTAVKELHVIKEIKTYSYQKGVVKGWQLTEVCESLVRSATLNCWFVSQIFGAIFAPFLTDHYGRKVAYHVASLVMLMSTAFQYFAVIYYIPEIFIIGRSFCAFCSPLSDAALIMYLQECSPAHLRGAFSFMCEIGYGLMCLLGMILGMRAVLGYKLSLLIGFSLIPQVFLTIFLVFIPETPKYLMITRNDRVRALKSLEFFQGKKSDTIRSSINVLTTWHLRQAVILTLFILVLSLPFYPVLQSSTYFSSIAEFSSMILMLLLTVSSVIGTTFVDRYPRRTLLFIFGILSTVFLTLFSVTASLSGVLWWMKYASLILAFVKSFCRMVVGPMTWFLGLELVGQKHRATVFCFCFAVCNILIAITNFASVPLFEHVGPLTFIPLYVVPSVLALVYLYIYLPETWNREIYQIVKSLRSRSMNATVNYENRSTYKV